MRATDLVDLADLADLADLVDLADQIDAQWLSSKWRDREWRPLVSMTLGWDATRAPLAVTSTGAAQHASARHGADATGAAANASERARACLEQPSVIWAGSHRAGLVPGAALPNKDLPNKDLPHQGTSRAEAVRRQLLDAVRAHLVKLDPTAAEWVGNLTVHLDGTPSTQVFTTAPCPFPTGGQSHCPSRRTPNTARTQQGGRVYCPPRPSFTERMGGLPYLPWRAPEVQWVSEFIPTEMPTACPSGRHEWPHS